MTFEQSVQEVYYWQYGGSTSFISMLFTLWMKGDVTNKRRLEESFQQELAGLKAWYDSPDPAEFFKQHGLNP